MNKKLKILFLACIFRCGFVFGQLSSSPQGPACMRDTINTDNEIAGVCFIVYPNPFHEQTLLTANDELINYNIVLYDHNGTMVKPLYITPHSTTLTINRENLEAGIYYLKII